MLGLAGGFFGRRSGSEAVRIHPFLFMGDRSEMAPSGRLPPCQSLLYTAHVNMLPFSIPPEVIDWIRDVFAAVNDRVSAKVTAFPTTHETSLDMTFIEEVSQHSAPVKFSSDWLVRLETHFLGGGRYWGRWEVADIGVLIAFRRGGVVQQTKIALLQSKRLYPVEAQTATEDHPIDYVVGFSRLLAAEQEYRSGVKARAFSSIEDSRYRALEYGDGQYRAILKYKKDTTIPVHYLLYNPLQLPITVTYPIEAGATKLQVGSERIGARVISAVSLDAQLQQQKLRAGENPAFNQILRSNALSTNPPWTLEYFIADLVLSCKEGHVAGVNPMEDEALYTVFNRRSGPISAAIAITIDAPAEAATEASVS